MMYAMSVYKQAFIVHRRTVGGAQLQGMTEALRNDGNIHSSLGKYFVRDVLEMHFPLSR